MAGKDGKSIGERKKEVDDLKRDLSAERASKVAAEGRAADADRKLMAFTRIATRETGVVTEGAQRLVGLFSRCMEMADAIREASDGMKAEAAELKTLKQSELVSDDQLVAALAEANERVLVLRDSNQNLIQIVAELRQQAARAIDDRDDAIRRVARYERFGVLGIEQGRKFAKMLPADWHGRSFRNLSDRATDKLHTLSVALYNWFHDEFTTLSQREADLRRATEAPVKAPEPVKVAPTTGDVYAELPDVQPGIPCNDGFGGPKIGTVVDVHNDGQKVDVTIALDNGTKLGATVARLDGRPVERDADGLVCGDPARLTPEQAAAFADCVKAGTPNEPYSMGVSEGVRMYEGIPVTGPCPEPCPHGHGTWQTCGRTENCPVSPIYPFVSKKPGLYDHVEHVGDTVAEPNTP